MTETQNRPAAASPSPGAVPQPTAPVTDKDVPDAARRALAEAEERRAKAKEMAELPPEEGGRGGKEPVRYGDWEVKGIATDF
ncbi:MAG: DUF1674 domain-containing protein [Pseudomonadota bacterium]